VQRFHQNRERETQEKRFSPINKGYLPFFVAANAKLSDTLRIARSDSIRIHSSCSQKHTAVAVNCLLLVSELVASPYPVLAKFSSLLIIPNKKGSSIQ